MKSRLAHLQRIRRQAASRTPGGEEALQAIAAARKTPAKGPATAKRAPPETPPAPQAAARALEAGILRRGRRAARRTARGRGRRQPLHGLQLQLHLRLLLHTPTQGQETTKSSSSCQQFHWQRLHFLEQQLTTRLLLQTLCGRDKTQ